MFELRGIGSFFAIISSWPLLLVVPILRHFSIWYSFSSNPMYIYVYIYIIYIYIYLLILCIRVVCLNG